MTTQNKPNDLNTVETAFYRSLGDGKKAASTFATLVHSVVSSRDTTVFVRQMDKIRKNKNDRTAIAAMAKVIKAVWPGCKPTVNKDGQHKIIIKGITADKDALKRMDAAVKRGLSLRDTFAKEVQGDVEKVYDKAQAPKKAKAWAKTFCDNYGITADSLIAMLQAKDADVASLVEPASKAAPKVSAAAKKGDRNADHVTH